MALDYGFIESRPDRDIYTLTLEIAESDPFYGDKLDIAESNGLGETAYFDIVVGCPLPSSILPYLRLVTLGGTDAFLLESIFRNSVWGHLELPVSRANEEMICQAVRNACKTALSAYNTTLQEVTTFFSSLYYGLGMFHIFNWNCYSYRLLINKMMKFKLLDSPLFLLSEIAIISYQIQKSLKTLEHLVKVLP